mmetsp:Transcript_6062/g.13097  ORF Transcript_6062/g.13097 Transcript_6062/m.13097 type:complete len:230 (+) Transcript_6062:889-1578(+)
MVAETTAASVRTSPTEGAGTTGPSGGRAMTGPTEDAGTTAPGGGPTTSRTGGARTGVVGTTEGMAEVAGTTRGTIRDLAGTTRAMTATTTMTVDAAAMKRSRVRARAEAARAAADRREGEVMARARISLVAAAEVEVLRLHPARLTTIGPRSVGSFGGDNGRHRGSKGGFCGMLPLVHVTQELRCWYRGFLFCRPTLRHAVSARIARAVLRWAGRPTWGMLGCSLDPGW